MLKKLLTGKALAMLGAVTLVSAGAAAAATGTVPSPFASDNAKEVTGDRVPDIARENVAKHADEAATEDTEATEDTTPATEPTEDTTLATDVTTDHPTQSDATETIGPDATGPAKHGLCTAFAAHAKDPDDDAAESTDIPIPFQNLTDAATAAGQSVEEFCADATPGKSGFAPGQSDDSPSATAPGQSDDSPSATAPGQSDDSPSATAPGQSDDSPSATAPGKAKDKP